MSSVALSPSGWTLRFKNHKTTTLLHVDPLQLWSSVKADLLHALKETHPDGRLASGTEIPSDPEDIILAKAKDFHDLTIGWERISAGDVGALAITNSKKKRVNIEDCPKGAGLKDGHALVYKFRADDEDMDEGLDLDDEDEHWDVIVPTYEEMEGGLPLLPVVAD
jgi:hypothetical protein